MLTLGIDEVGRGAWAGPMAVGAVILDSSIASPVLAKNIVLADSKKLTKRQRERSALWVKQNALAIGVGWVSAGEIDRFGLSRALKTAARRAVAQIPPEILRQTDQIITDGRVKLLNDSRETTLVKADAKIAAVSAAAIVAKVARDTYMIQLDKVFPQYNFDKHVGYGTAKHREKLEKFGAATGVHRQSFAPIFELAGGASRGSAQKSFSEKKFLGAERATGPAGVATTIGRIAENVAAEFLKTKGHQIVAQNWRTKFCEIDIISCHDDTIYFTEVKYRANARHGDGLAAITPKKLKQMKFAAEFYLTKNAEPIKKYDVRLTAISLSGNPPMVDRLIDNIWL